MSIYEQYLKNYIFKNPLHKWLFWTGITGIIVQFTAFKYFYPYAGFINNDSYAYLEAAYYNAEIHIYPIGYSMFLRLFSVFSRSDTVLVAFQYMSIQISIFYFLFTLFYFYNPGKPTKILLFGFILFNPVYLYLSNYVSSDALFLSLSMLWFTQLLWINYAPINKLIIVNAFLLSITFTVRYNALYYPIIAGIAFILSRQRIAAKLAGLALGIALIGCFMVYTSNMYFKQVGIRQFSPFSGWQMANNALYAYRYVEERKAKKVPAPFNQLDMAVRRYFDTTRDLRKHPQEVELASTGYMWDPRSPLFRFMEEQLKNDPKAGRFRCWAKVGALYGGYGSFLIQQYPGNFIEYYVLPNTLKFIAPPVEFLSSYSTGVDSVQPVAKIWFRYDSNKIKCHFKDFKVSIFNYYPILISMTNILFLFSMLSLIFHKHYKKYKLLRNTLLLAISLWGVNAGFSIFASAIALRFQLFPALVSLSFTILAIECLIQQSEKLTTKKQEPPSVLQTDDIKQP